jgi:alkanesulfonate monooxygenase SsuD/methylene tetrahydromethanopterin reductase-like flavin-dependent oxidoreductase (luciferase family)
MKVGIFPKEGGDWSGFMDGVTAAEDVGLDSVWVCDHQATESGNYWPEPLTRLAAMAARTDDLDFVTGVIVLPLYHPLHVAQQAAMVDQLSDGGLTLGAAVGYVPKEFDAFGIDMDDRAGRLIEGMNFLDAYFTADGPFDFDSPFVSVEDWRPLPQAKQDPRPPLWVGGWGEKAIQRGVTFGDAWLPGMVADNEAVRERKETQAAYADEIGVDYDAMAHPHMREGIVAETKERAMELGREYLHDNYRQEYGSDDWEHPLVSSDAVQDFDTLVEDRFLVGTPADIVAEVESMAERMPMTHLGVRLHHSGMPTDVLREQIELFGDEVAPALR